MPVAVLGWLAVWALFGDSIAYLGYLNGGGFVWGLASLLAALLFLLRKEWLWGLGTLGMALAVIAHGSGFNSAALGASGSAKADDTVRVVSASLRGRNDNMADAAAVLANLDPDVVAAQEVSDKALLKQELETATGTRWNLVSRELLVILAKAPVSAQPDSGIGHLLRATVDMDGRALNIWTLRAPKSFARPIENSRFYAGLERLIIAENPDAVTGDFNASVWNQGYAQVAKHMTNAQSAAGFGPGNSFPSDGRISGLLGAFARIDHIFAGPDKAVNRAFTANASEGADHHPVVADIKLEE